METLAASSSKTSTMASTSAVAGPSSSHLSSSSSAITASLRTRYTVLKKVGEGTYASVFLARDTQTGDRVAIKRIKIAPPPPPPSNAGAAAGAAGGAGTSAGGRDGLDPTALREVGFLQEASHPNIISLLAVYSSGSASSPSLNLVLEFLDTNLEALIKDRELVFRQGDVKAWLGMLLSAVEYCHEMGCLHRDLKPNNLLISPSGQLKLADFGLAREIPLPSSLLSQAMTSQVITLWYRPPELLLGAKHYTTSVDIWSVGCIFAEMLLRTPYMPGEGEIGQLEMIGKARGSPTAKPDSAHPASSSWLGWTPSLLPKATERLPSTSYPRPNHAALFSAASRGSIPLLDAMLEWDPTKRPSATSALCNPYFTSLAPKPTRMQDLPRHKGEGKEEEVGKGLMSDREDRSDATNAKVDKVKREEKEQQQTSSSEDGLKRPAAEVPSGAAINGGSGKRQKLGQKQYVGVSKEVIEQRRAMARKMAFG